MTVWFDVEDLFHHLRGAHARPTGIQRLTFEVYRAAVSMAEVRFVRHGPGPRSFGMVRWAGLAAAFDRAGVRVTVQDQTRDPRQVHTPSRPMRAPLVQGAVQQGQAAMALAQAGQAAVTVFGRAALRRVRRDVPAAGSFEASAKPGDTLLVLGSPWFRQRYSELARWVRDERRMRFGVLVHDLVPLRRPEWSAPDVTRDFKEWYADVLPFCDLVLANSRHTATDVEAYAREIGLALPRPVRALPVGTGFGEGPVAQTARLPRPGSYVLFVSTMEARKNHELMVRVWRRLLAEVASGTRAVESVPDLVFAGRIGWQVADLLQQLDNTSWLNGRIRLVQAPSDGELRALYQGCLFTVFPSLHEGWGLPVTESLAMGKPCLVSNAAALPEAGGALCRYFDPEDVGGAHRAVAAVLDDPAGLAAWEARVRTEFRPVPWTETARAVLDEAAVPRA